MGTGCVVDDPLLSGIRALGSRGLGIHGAQVVIRDHVPAQHHWTSDIRRDVFSVSKTFTSVAIGIAQDENLLDVNDTVLSHLGHLSQAVAPGVEAITIRHLLTMSSGIVFRWDDPDADHPGDAAADIVATPLGAEPGTAFAYRGANTYLLSRIIAACSGQDLRDFLTARLFAPLGISKPQWQRCPLGYSLGATGLRLRTEEIARLGRTLLDGGRFNRDQLIPVDYVDSMISDPVEAGHHVATGATEPHRENSRYGLHAWLCERDSAWRMDGIYGQFSVMLPRQGACVTVTSHYAGPTTDILDAIWSDIVPALG
jgi:CubicO group peptidase (beta-lactamase class C family)